MRGGGARVVRKGKLRVDARKAITKLRDHLLVDLHLYAVEVVRAAVLAGATRVDVTYDADDVVIAFDGRALPADELPRLFEHLTGGGDGAEARSPRLLALAVNAALGLAPAWISLTTAQDGQAARVTWTPALVAAIEREERELPEPEAIAPPGDMPATGTRFQLRRKVGWDVVRRAAARTPPRELALLAQAAACPRVPLFVQGEPAAPPDRPRAVARATLQLPGARAAWVEITAATDVAPHADFCEVGLVLARTGFAFGRHFPLAGHAGVAPPVRVVIDADALPANASRSAVREDTPLLRALPAAAAGALADAIAGITAALFGRGSVPDGVTIDASDRAALEDALGAFLCSAEASLRARVALPDALRALLDLPLFRDGLGRPMTHAEIPRLDPLLVWTSDEPLPAEMGPWARSIIRASGRGEGPVAERVLAARAWMDPDKLAGVAKAGAERYRKLVAMPASEPSVPDDAYLCRRRLAVADGPLAGLAGEVAVVPGGAPYVRNHALRVYLEGRCFQTFAIAEDAVPLRCVVALEWPGRLAPRFAYDGVTPGEELRSALAFAVREAVLLCERVAAEREHAGGAFDEAEASMLRRALATAGVAPVRLGAAEGVDMPALADLPALVRAPVWPAPGERFTSLQALCEYAARTGAVCAVSPRSAGVAPDERPVVRLPSQEVEHLRACLHPRIVILRYDAALVSGAPEGRRRTRERMTAYVHLAAAEAKAPVLRVAGPGHVCLVTLGRSEVRVWHGLTELPGTQLEPAYGGVTMAIDDDTLVPSEKWDAVLFSENAALAGHAERAFAERVTAAALGDERARAELFHEALGLAPVPYAWPREPRDLPAAVRRYLIDRAARGRAVDADDEARALAERVEVLPLLTMIGEDGEPAPASLAAVAAAHPAPDRIPCLQAPPSFKPARWRPVIEGQGLVREALARWSGGRSRLAENELPEQERAALRETEYMKFLQRPVLDVAVVGPRGDRGCPTVFLPPAAGPDVPGVAAALPAPGESSTHAVIEVLLEGRFVGEEVLSEVAIPLVARVSVAERASVEGLRRLSATRRWNVEERVRQAAEELALRVVERASHPGAEHTLFRDLRALRLVLSALRERGQSERLRAALFGGQLLWPAVQGRSRPFIALHRADGQLWAGTIAYASWITASPPSELDRPILHVSPGDEGAAVVGLLEHFKIPIRPVSDAIASLQAKRARGATERPRLAERPADPALARDLEKLGVKGLEGEVGLFDAGEAVAEIHTLDGETKRILLELPFPARAVARAEVLTRAAAASAAQGIARAAVALLAGLSGSLDALPPFVRAHLRALVCEQAKKGGPLPEAVRRAPLFADVDGGFWSYEQLLAEGGDWSCTFDPPPYAKARQEGRTLVLTRAEHLMLHARVPILNVTEWMRRDLEAERRREGPRVERARFDGAARAHFAASFEVEDGALSGEIGLLRPGSDGARGVQVLVNRRPLCRIDDGPGWPLAAVVNDDTLHPDRWFSALPPVEETTLRARVRRLATEHLQGTLGASLPEGRLAGVFLDRQVPPVESYDSTAPMTLTGHLYLPATWPVDPSARIWVQGVDKPFEGPIALATSPIHPVLPIGGVFFVAHKEAAFHRGAAARVALCLRSALEELLAPFEEAGSADPEILAYLWNLRLLGGVAVDAPTAVAAGGEVVTVGDVLRALEKGEIWLTDRRGSIDGAFPGGAPPFVLRDEPSPLVRVLRARAPRERLRLLGGQAVDRGGAPAVVSAGSGAGPGGFEAPAPAAPALAEPVLAPPSVPPPRAPAPEVPDITVPAAPESRRRPSRSWLGAVIERVSEALSGGSGAEAPPTEISVAVERALRALRLRDEPVIVVREARRGRLLRYDKANRVVTINIAHPALAKVVAAPTPGAVRRACLALTAAAVTEVNIALEHVTDHDEREALLELLRQDAAAATATAGAQAAATATAGAPPATAAGGAKRIREVID